MTQAEFQLQMARLGKEFGEKNYSTERIGMIWREVQDFSASWLVKTVNEFIGSARIAPLLPDFREAASRERDRLWSVQKLEHRKQAEEFMESFYGNKDIQVMCEYIRQRLQGRVSDQDYSAFVSNLKSISEVA